MKDLEEIRKDIWSMEDVEERKKKIVQYILESMKEPRDFEEEALRSGGKQFRTNRRSGVKVKKGRKYWNFCRKKSQSA